MAAGTVSSSPNSAPTTNTTSMTTISGTSCTT
ncbi:Uncharacterised protein [Bordetella pertussis]|nr:Uncharacterised protein [Bordetella pertussis]